MFKTKIQEKIKTHFIFNKCFSKIVLFEIMWKNIVELGRPQMTIKCIRVACWIPKATNTHSQYVILMAFLLQQWLHTLTSVLHYMYIACLVSYA
jgi:hypothetical protein